MMNLEGRWKSALEDLSCHANELGLHAVNNMATQRFGVGS